MDDYTKQFLVFLDRVRDEAKNRWRLVRDGNRDHPAETLRELELIVDELDRVERDLRAGKAPPPIRERRLVSARIISDWWPRTPLGGLVADLCNAYDRFP